MKYPVLKRIHEEVIEGGWTQLLIDMTVFYFKFAVFFFALFSGIWLMSLLVSNTLINDLTPGCVQEIIDSYGR